MTAFKTGHPVDYSVFTASDADEMVELLGETFAKRDPPAVAMGLTPVELAALVRLFCLKAGTEGLTMIARSSETGEMMGALLTEDAASESPPGIDRLSAKFTPIFEMLSTLEAAYREGEPAIAGESLHLFLLGVAARFKGQGVAAGLVSQCVANGARRGYRSAVTEATNRTSQHIFRKQGFVERARKSYADHAAFASIAGEGGMILMDKVLAQL